MAAMDFEDAIQANEKEHLEKFKLLIAENGWQCPGRDDDEFLVRFLRARLMDLKKASIMYSDYVQWRKENSVSSILQDFNFPELHQVLQAMPQAWHKTDKFGRPLNVQVLSRLDVDALFNATTEERLVKRGMWVLEDVHEVRLPASSKAIGHYIGRVTVVVDLRNLGLKTFTNSHVRRVLFNMSRIFSLYYPEYLGRLFIVNAPATFKVIWQMICPFMEEKTKKKVRIHKGPGIEDLLTTIDAENLPAILGGDCQCARGQCNAGLPVE